MVNSFTLQSLILNFSRIIYFFLFILIVFWNVYLSPHPYLSPIFMLSIWAVPLIFLSYILFNPIPKNIVYLTLILPFYFMHAIAVFITEPAERYLALIEFILLLMLFVLCYVYIKKYPKKYNNNNR